MAAVSCALALLSGVIGAGFASGREIMYFFAGHGRAAGAAVICALMTLLALFLRLTAQMERHGCSSLSSLCRIRLGARLGALCSLLFFLLCMLTGAAMLAACAELIALILPIPHAYGVGLLSTLILSVCLSLLGLSGIASAGAVLCAALPALLFRLYTLPMGEACFLPAMAPDLPVRAAADGVLYGALNAAMVAGALPSLLSCDRKTQRRALFLFALLFGFILSLSVLVCRRHMSALWNEPLPFVSLSRALGAQGYLSLALCMYAAAFSTLLTMMAGMRRLLPLSPCAGTSLCALLCLMMARLGFAPIVNSGYPVLGALCAGLLTLLCFPMTPFERPPDTSPPV